MKNIFLIIAIVSMSIAAFGQGFVNLNFESAKNMPTNASVGGFVAASNALPGWDPSYGPGNTPVMQLFYMTNTTAETKSTIEILGGGLALDGNYSVYLNPTIFLNQTATVPNNALSLQFEGIIEVNGFYVSLGGVDLHYSLLSTGPKYDVYGANIPSYMDGQLETLSFFAVAGSGILDNIQFSAMSVPEPSEGFLISLGAILFSLFSLFKKIRGKRSVS